MDVSFIKGGFALGSTAVPYFSTCLPASQLRSMLRLPGQLPVDAEHPIKLEELFQRELNEERVTEQIMPYLRDDTRLRFFNALTVALLPLDPANPRRLAPKYPQDGTLAPPPYVGFTPSPVGPVMVSNPPGNDNVGYLSWNTRLTMPVVLDGQHRFRAIEMVLTDSSGQLFSDLSAMKVSVLFLVLDERVGFRAAEEVSVLAACRDIFIDLNKHAITVPRARLALLEDHSPWSMAMRCILASEVGLDARPVQERVYEDGRLPLALVDWRGDSAKFDSGPHLTSLLTLQDMVEHVLGLPAFRPRDYDRAREIVDRLAARLGLVDDDDFDVAKLQAAIDLAEAEERLFQLPRDAARTAGHAFAKQLGRRITQPLVHLAPYAALISRLESMQVLGTTLEPWLSFNEGERRGLLEQLGVENPAPAIESAVDAIKHDPYGLAFQVVFQKAFVYSANSMTAAAAQLAVYWKLPEATDGEDREETVLTEWIARFNDHVAPALGAERQTSPFLGSGLRPTGEIDFRKTRIRSITGFVSYLMLAPMAEWVSQQRAGGVDASVICAWIVEYWGAIAPGPRDPLTGLFSLHGKNWRNAIDELVLARASASDDVLDEETREAQRLEHATWQLQRAVELAALNQG